MKRSFFVLCFMMQFLFASPTFATEQYNGNSYWFNGAHEMSGFTAESYLCEGGVAERKALLSGKNLVLEVQLGPHHPCDFGVKGAKLRFPTQDVPASGIIDMRYTYGFDGRDESNAVPDLQFDVELADGSVAQDVWIHEGIDTNAHGHNRRVFVGLPEGAVRFTPVFKVDTSTGNFGNATLYLRNITFADGQYSGRVRRVDNPHDGLFVYTVQEAYQSDVMVAGRYGPFTYCTGDRFKMDVSDIFLGNIKKYAGSRENFPLQSCSSVSRVTGIDPFDIDDYQSGFITTNLLAGKVIDVMIQNIGNPQYPRNARSELIVLDH